MGVSLMYREGYFRQYLNPDGWQQERYPENDFFTLPLIPETDSAGQPLIISVPLPGRDVKVKIWRIQVGRVPLYLLDCNIPENNARRSQHHGPALRRRQGKPDQAGDRPRHWWRPRPAGARQGADRLPSQRRPFRLLCAGADSPRYGREEARLCHGRARSSRPEPASRRTRRCRPATRSSLRRLIETYLGGYMSPLGLDRKTFLGAGPAESERRRRTIWHDRAGTEAGERRQRRQPIARRGVAEDVGEVFGRACPKRRCRSRRSPTAYTPAAGCRRKSLRFMTATSGIQWEERPTDYAVWKRIEQVPDAELWRTAERAREPAGDVCPVAVAATVGPPRGTARRGCAGRRGSRPGRVDHRLSPAASPPTNAAR